MKLIRLILPLCALALSLSLPGQAQNSPAIDGPPDVVAIVYQQPGAADQVDITYDPAVPHAQALADCRALTQAGGWPSSPLQIKDAAAPVRSRSGLMTSVTFQALGVVQNTARTFPVDTFARAFHRYRRMNLVFLVGPQFQFQGVRSYADPNIRMSLEQRSTSYVYQIEILHPNSGVSLPPLGAVPAGTAHQSPWGRLLGILGAAALAGLAVYLLAARLTPKESPRPALGNDAENNAESQKEAAGKR